MRGHVVVVGLGFGDEGKGAVVDALCAARPTEAVVRFNGGAQAAHNVIVGGTHHTFSQFGSGTFAGVPTHLSRFVLVEPFALAEEARRLAAIGVADPLRLVSAAGSALLTTPFHIHANRAREDARGDRRHGSCGKGIGETVWYSLLGAAAPGEVVEGQRVIGAPGEAPRVADCADPAALRRKLDALARFYAPLAEPRHTVAELVGVYRDFAAAVRITDAAEVGRLADRGRLVMEGAQGVLLDQHHGFHPHTTWSSTTPVNARELLEGREHTVIGVTRTYHTRHGAGPLPTEDAALLERYPERHNGTGEYQGAWRVGHLDAALLDRAIAVCDGVDALAVTHLDAPTPSVVAAPGAAPVPLADPLAFFSARLPVAVTASGPARADYRVGEPVGAGAGRGTISG
ncbi:adenylosuccinate synthetase [Actinokineospora guangxiensis]|uniref:Adenylosuccinate synthetase n=1 Tax=Actinokineospora guangxiensis TaxID=1490288 RepID=A0ABW0EUK3_9PSEU